MVLTTDEHEWTLIFLSLVSIRVYLCSSVVKKITRRQDKQDLQDGIIKDVVHLIEIQIGIAIEIERILKLPDRSRFR